MKWRTGFVSDIRSRQTLRSRPAAERRISLKHCYKTVGSENRLVVQEMPTPLRRHTNDRVPTSIIS
jgi:hypothetical protein